MNDGVSFNGMVGMLQRKEVDVCIGSVDIQELRSRAIDYTSGIFADNAKIFIQSSGSARLNYYEMFLIFRKDVWQLIVVLLLGTSIVFFLHFRSETDGHSLSQDLTNASALSMRAVILKGHSRVPGRIGGKVGMIAILLFGIMIFALYRGGILSKLAVKKAFYPIASFEDILHSDFDLGTVEGTNTQTYFEQGPEGSVRKSVWSSVQDNLMGNNDQGILQMLKDEHFAFFMYASSGKASEYYPCHIVDVGEPYMKVNEAIAFQKNSSLREIFDFQLVKMRENGFLSKINQKWQSDNSGMADCHQFSDLDLGYEELMGIFMILCLGMIFSVVLVGLEKSCHQIH